MFCVQILHGNGLVDAISRDLICMVFFCLCSVLVGPCTLRVMFLLWLKKLTNPVVGFFQLRPLDTLGAGVSPNRGEGLGSKAPFPGFDLLEEHRKLIKFFTVFFSAFSLRPVVQ